MSDEEVGEVHLLLGLDKEVYDLGLDGDVQGRDRLVADDGHRVQGQGAGDSNPLPLATSEFVGAATHLIRMESDLIHQISWKIIKMAFPLIFLILSRSIQEVDGLEEDAPLNLGRRTAQKLED